MADKDDKQFDATPQRLKQAREDGNVFKSQEVTSLAMLLASAAVIALGVVPAFEALQNATAAVLVDSALTTLDVPTAASVLTSLGWRVMLVLLPFFAALLLAAIGVNMAQVGILFTLKPLQPKASRINPGSGLKRIFSSKGLFETFKAMAKIAILGPIAYFYVAANVEEMLMVHALPLPSLLGQTGSWLAGMLLRIFLTLVALSAADFAFQKWKYLQDLKMSKQEVKDESKNTEGDQQVKGRMRQRAREILSRPRLETAILDADVIVVNPTHYAVAIRYNPELDGAPRVLVKGVDRRALRIKAMGEEHDVPTIQNVPLARGLWAAVDEMEEIPAEMYQAVAALLAEVFHLKR